MAIIGEFRLDLQCEDPLHKRDREPPVMHSFRADSREKAIAAARAMGWLIDDARLPTKRYDPTRKHAVLCPRCALESPVPIAEHRGRLALLGRNEPAAFEAVDAAFADVRRTERNRCVLMVSKLADACRKSNRKKMASELDMLARDMATVQS